MDKSSLDYINNINKINERLLNSNAEKLEILKYNSNVSKKISKKYKSLNQLMADELNS
jgi:hypothetical protein